jgi:hypothetical protein
VQPLTPDHRVNALMRHPRFASKDSEVALEAKRITEISSSGTRSAEPGKLINIELNGYSHEHHRPRNSSSTATRSPSQPLW